MVWTCDRGCLTDGKPTKHANQGACPVIRAERQAAKTRPAPESSSDPPRPRIPEEPPKPKEPPKSGWDRFVEFVREPAKTVSSPEVPEKQESYLLEGDDVVNFWQIVFSMLEYGLNLFLRFFGAKELPEDLCDIKKSKASSLLVSRNMRHSTSQLFISLGVRTKGEAQAIIGEGEGLLAFGHIFAGIGYHLWTELPKTEKWKELTKNWSLLSKPAPAVPPGADGPAASANPWWDPLGVFPKKAEPEKTTTALAVPGAG